MVLYILRASVLAASLGACSGGRVNPPDERPPASSTSSALGSPELGADGLPIAAEPVAIGGAYLSCAYTKPDRTAAGCRVENKDRTKFTLKRINDSDVEAMDANKQPLPIAFALAPSFSMWHWVTTSPMNFPADTQIFVALAGRFKSKAIPQRISVIANEHPLQESLGDLMPIEGAPPIVSLEAAVLSANGALEVGNYRWYLTQEGESCENFCTNKSGLAEKVTAAWARDPQFCVDMLTKLHPERTGKIIPVLVAGEKGMGCFTEGGNSGTQTLYVETSGIFNRGALAPKSRRFCACD